MYTKRLRRRATIDDEKVLPHSIQFVGHRWKTIEFDGKFVGQIPRMKPAFRLCPNCSGYHMIVPRRDGLYHCCTCGANFDAGNGDIYEFPDEIPL